MSAIFFLSNDTFAAFNSSSTSFKASDQNVSDIGGNTISTSFRLYQNAGQTSVGESSSTNFKVRAGVLYWDALIATPTPTPASVDSGGGGGGGGGNVYGATPTPGTSGVTSTPIVFTSPGVPGAPTCDFNHDGFCNIIDLSILLYWYGKTGNQIIPYDLNRDRSIDLKDISILFYHWDE